MENLLEQGDTKFNEGKSRLATTGTRDTKILGVVMGVVRSLVVGDFF